MGGIPYVKGYIYNGTLGIGILELYYEVYSCLIGDLGIVFGYCNNVVIALLFSLLASMGE